MSPSDPPAITTVVFDFDGVLADTEGLHLRAFQDVFARQGWTLDAPTYFDRYLGCDDHGLVVAYAADNGLTLSAAEMTTLEALKTRAFAGYLEAGDVLFPNARSCVTALAREFRLAIASGALHAEIVAILDAAGLTAHFPIIVAADDVDQCKPSPVPYATAAAQLGVAPSACVAVEDSAAGLQAASAAGMHTIAITTTSPHALLTRADRLIADLAELTPALVHELGRRPVL